MVIDDDTKLLLDALKSNPDFLLKFHESTYFEADEKFDKMRRMFLEILKEMKRDEILNELLEISSINVPVTSLVKKEKGGGARSIKKVSSEKVGEGKFSSSKSGK